MSLQKYKTKRSFTSTQEPTGGKSSAGNLNFVIQKHDATRLHYDFRLEMDGVLKSWAVPKGPSTDPSVKRLAMMVEDHPYDYKDFEGVIPKGNYGAGSVIVWDKGTYEPLEPVKNKKEAEKILLKELKSGSLKFSLHGQKLNGEFALVKLKGNEDNSWLLIKHRDKFAKETDVTKKAKSVVSGKTVEKMAKEPDKIYGRKTIEPGLQGKRNSAEKTIKKKTVKEHRESDVNTDLTAVPKSAMPKTISPMLATLIDKPFEEAGWLYEIKWDGYRAIALCNDEKVEIISRNNKAFTEKFYPVHDALAKLKYHTILDGEIVVLNDKGISNFGALQNWRSEADGDLMYYVFDILWLNGHNLTTLPLSARRKFLDNIIPVDSIIRKSQNFETSATEFLEASKKMGLEGIIAKKAQSVYSPGIRSREWLKIKAHKRHEVVIAGFTKNDDSPKLFSSLLVGVHEKGKLIYTGKIGTGFSDKLQKDMMKLFRPLITKDSPFATSPDINKPSRFRPNPPHAKAVWLKPKIVCEVSYAEMTLDGVMRHPSFEGLREDKSADDVVKEKEMAAEKIVNEKSTMKTRAKKSAEAKIKLKPASSKELKTLLNPSEETQVKKVNGHELKFNNLEKKYWPKEGYTKRDMLNYYYQVAPFIIPYLKNRPQSLNRFPNGITGKSFYQKDITATAPDWVKKFPYHTNGENKNFLVVEDEASLLWMANLGSIEMNPWNSTINNPDNPDWCIIDLDPTEKNSFDQVIETALVTKKVLELFKVDGYCKTSGSTGMHIYIPMGAKYGYDDCQLFGKLIATQVHQELLTFTSIERMTQKRKGKIYIDYLQNRAQATLAAPYSLRPKPGATVSMPLGWDEVKKGLKMTDFTIKNAIERIQSQGDLFKPVLGKGVNLQKILG
jgi:bifunctional non-homologous end joining protein LigD